MPGAFTREVIEAMAAATKRPLIFPISNPTSQMEAMPPTCIGWSDGKPLVATAARFAPVEYDGTTYTIGQANNVLVFPGIGLGVVVAGAERVTKSMLDSLPKPLRNKCPISSYRARRCCRRQESRRYRRWLPRLFTMLPSRMAWRRRNPTTLSRPSATPHGYPETTKEMAGDGI